MKAMFRLAFCLFFFTAATACSDKSKTAQEPPPPPAPPPAPALLKEVSGVWRSTDGTLISIVYADKKMRLSAGDNFIPVVLGDVDEDNKTVNLNVTLETGQPGIWTLREIWNSDKTSYFLQLTLHDGTQDRFTFIRKISKEDLDRFAAAESLQQARSVAKEATQAAFGNAAPTPSDSMASSALPVRDGAETASPATAGEPELQPASFDCAKPFNAAEQLICSSKDVSDADGRMARVYATALARSNNKEALKSQQQAWLNTIRNSCTDAICMLTVYKMRLSQLSGAGAESN